jgi:hypothetical protein
MAEGISQYSRDRVVGAIDVGLSRRGVAARFKISVSSAIRSHQLAGEHFRAVARSLAWPARQRPKPMPNRS